MSFGSTARLQTALPPLLLAGVLLISLCSNLFTPLSHDQGMYQYITDRVMAGERMYVDVWDQNTPGIIGVHWLATRLCGSTSLALRTFDAGWQLATLFCLVLLGGRDGKNWRVGWLAATLYALAYYGLGYVHTCQREGFTVLPLLLAILAMTGGRTGQPVGALSAAARHAFAGLMFFAVFAIKPPLGLIFGALWLSTLAEIIKGRHERRPLAALAGLTIGFCAGTAVGVALLIRWGWWSAFWPTLTRSRIPGYVLGPTLLRELAVPLLLGAILLTVAILLSGGREETGARPAAALKRRLLRRWPMILTATVLLGVILSILRWPTWQLAFLRFAPLLIPAAGAVLIRSWGRQSLIWRMQCLIAGASLAAIVLQGQFYPYQFPPLLAAAAYLTAGELVGLVSTPAENSQPAARIAGAWPLFCLAWAICLVITPWGQAVTFPSARPYFLSNRTLMRHYADITKHRTSFPRFDTCAAVADRVRALTAPTDRMVCLVDEPRLYWLSRRPAGCPLLRPCEVHRNLFPEFMQRIREVRPAVLLARIPAEAMKTTDRTALETAMIEGLISFYGPLAGEVCRDYCVTEIVDDVCILQPRTAGR